MGFVVGKVYRRYVLYLKVKKPVSLHRGNTVVHVNSKVYFVKYDIIIIFY